MAFEIHLKSVKFTWNKNMSN